MASKRAEDLINGKIAAPKLLGGLSKLGVQQTTQAKTATINNVPQTQKPILKQAPTQTLAPNASVGDGLEGATWGGGTQNRPSTKQSTFDTSAMYQTALAAKKAQLEANLNTQLNTLQKNYNTNMLGYDSQKTDLGNQYEQGIESIQDNTYRNIEAGKVNATQRGIMNSNMGLALGQASMRAGSEQQSYATQQRNDLLNEINSQINNLTKGYNNDKLTAQTNYGLGQTQALNEALQTKLGADMNIWQQNDQQDFTSGENALSREQAEMLARLQMENSLKVAGIGAGSAANQLAWAKEMYGMEQAQAADENKFNFITSLPGFNPNDKLGLFDGASSKSANNVSTMQELMKLSGLSQSDITNYTNQYFTTNARKYGDSFTNFLQSILGPK